MNTVFKAQTTIKADIEDVATFFAQTHMAGDYFPEVSKDTKNVTTYIRNSHKHPDQVFPDYQIRKQGLGWTTGGGTIIKLPRKDIEANINAIDVEFADARNYTTITIQVEFDTEISIKGIIASRHVYMMMTNKLNAIKRDLEANLHQGWVTSYA